jgi:hypothetical protein
VHPSHNAQQQRFSKALNEERMTGIEPALSAWEAEVLPLNYIRVRHPPAHFCG